MDESKQPGLVIGQIHLLQVYFNHREDALSLPHDTKMPELRIDITFKVGSKEDDSEGVIVAGVKTADDQNGLYSFHVQMVALVKREAGAENLGVQEYLTKNGAAMMYPFLREALANITGRGRFGPIWLKPLNVKALQSVAETKGEQVSA